ncbi:hypothetical protein ASPCADRAFT_18683, partial [Aspergillus carbonarius ITEM 5010]
MGLDVPAGTPDRGPAMAVLLIVLLVLTALMTVIRIASKVLTHQRWWWDDFFAILSLPTEMVMFSLLLAWKHIGLGLHMDLVLATDPNLLVTGGRYFYVATMFFDSSICLPKLSAIFFYARVFRTNDRSLRLQLWALGLIVAGWLLSAYLVTIFQCHPIQRAWNTALPGTCVNTYRWFLATAALSCVIDIWILVVPIPRIWGLQASRRRRIYLLGAFFLAYSVIVLSVGRLVATVQLVPRLAHDETWEMPVYMYWAALEASISIISVSTPNATALVKSLWHRDPP